MKKITVLLILLVFMSVNPASAQIDSFQNKLDEITEQRASLRGKITDDVSLAIQDNKLIVIQKAYKNAIKYLQQDVFNEFVSTNFAPFEQVPEELIPLYKAAATRFNVDWYVLAAIHDIETDFSQIKRMVSYAGAIGHMQFMPATFAAYGVDGNGDGRKDPWNLEDAVFSAANYLAASGYSKDIRKAIWHYNHADWYVEQVIEKAAKIRSS